MSPEEIAWWLHESSRALRRLSARLRDTPGHKNAFYALNRALTSIDEAERHMRDDEPIEPAPRSKP